MAVWSFDVAVSTHEAVMAGVLVLAWSRVTVAADRHVEASLVAAQMASRHGMVTDVLVRL